MRHLALAILLVPFLALPAPAEDEPEKKKPEKWDVADPGGPYRTLEIDTDTGTWMNVDVHPDGKELVFDLLGDLYTLPIEGGQAKALTSGLAWDTQPRWSPDGSKILFTSDRGGGDNAWVMDATGENAAAVTEEEFRLCNNGIWHPTDDYVVVKKHFTSGRSLGAGEMWMYRFPDGGKGVKLTKRKNDQQDVGEPELSPDGKFLYWSEDMSGGKFFEYNKDPHGTIYVIRRLDMETGEVQDLIRRPGGAISPRASPDGKTLAFVRRKGNTSVLALLDLESGAIRDLWDGLSIDQQETWAIFGPYPSYGWTPDSRSIVVWGKGKLHRVDVASGKATAIPFRVSMKQTLLPTARIEHPAWEEEFLVRVVRWPQVAPDGATVVFQALGHLYKRDIGEIEIGGSVTRITSQTDEFEFAPRLLPGGKAVVYTTWNDTRGGFIKQVNLDGTGGKVLVDRPGHYASVDIAKNGREIVYRRVGGDTYRGGKFASEPGIYRLKLEDGHEPRLLTRRGRKPRFSADGRRVLLIGREKDKNALFSVDRIGSDRRVIATSKHASDFAVSPDGRWLAFEELWQTYLCPLPPSPTAIAVGPKNKNVPVVRLSTAGGTYLSWSEDSNVVGWSLGPDLFETTTGAHFARWPETHTQRFEAQPVRIGWNVPSDKPDTDVYLVGGTVLPMHDMSVIEDGVVHVKGNRIEAVGKRDEVAVPDGANVIDVSGKTVMPGIVDVHSHHGSSNSGLHSQQSWAFLAHLAYGVTTIHDPSNNTQMIYGESELVRAGRRIGPRVFSTGTILYGAEGDFKAVINGYDDAVEAIKRTMAWGPRSVKSYQQPRRDQRQQVMKAARALGCMVMPEGGSTYHQNMTQILDGHTTMEHAIPIAPLQSAAVKLFAESGTCYTPTLTVGYGGLWGENYWYAKTNVWKNERLLKWVPRSVVDPRARRRTLAVDDSDYHHIRLASTCKDVLRAGGTVQVGAHGQMQGLGSHWELWMFEQGGMTPHEALRCATHGGARAICLDDQIGSLLPGYLADLMVVDGKPLENVRDSEKLVYTMVNGRLYDAQTLAQLRPDRVELPAGPDLDSIRTDTSHAHCACGR